ncbi:hypothetical protein Pfo_019524 [Paulownia fortunei]|nr:hypothetical protein Pfo_019524 [Paulownia fortunei]
MGKASFKLRNIPFRCLPYRRLPIYPPLSSPLRLAIGDVILLDLFTICLIVHLQAAGLYICGIPIFASSI